jgi:putative colanic acid biosynthesis acetyltransferase WcaF
MSLEKTRLRAMIQRDAYTSPWTFRHRIKFVLWNVVYAIFFRTTPKFLNPWRVGLLKLFGATIRGVPFVASSAIIKFPWNLTLEHRACLGPRCEVYNLDKVVVREGATIAQEAYLCGGTHDFTMAELPLVVGPIEIGAGAFVGARAFVLPGVIVGDRAIIGACALVNRDVQPEQIVAGNPSRVIGIRQHHT